MLQQVSLPFELYNSEVNVDLVVADKIVFLSEVFLCTVDSVKFNFPTILSQKMYDIICKHLAIEWEEY